MEFRTWLENQEISEPYYRVVNKAMYGGAAEEKLGHILAPGTYWTPRWDSVIMMLGSIAKHYKPGLPDEDWRTTVYQINKAIMTDPPKEHRWAFQYGVDAGEQVLVQALEQPFIASDPETGIKIDKLHPMLDRKFLEILLTNMSQGIGTEPPTDWERQGIEAILNGRKVYIGCDYDQAEIIVYKKEGWKFTPILRARSNAEWEKIYKKLKIIDQDSPGVDALTWFFHDMDQDNRPGWKMVWKESVEKIRFIVTPGTTTKFEAFVDGINIEGYSPGHVGQAFITHHSQGQYTLDAIDVPEEIQRQGYGTRIMQEIKKFLCSQKAVKLFSSNEGSGTVQILDRVFGRKNVTHKHGGQKVSYTKAVHVMDVLYGYTGSEVDLRKACKAKN